MSERVRIDALQPGMVIVQITEQNGPVRIRKSGLVTSDAMVLGLREMGVLELEIDPEQTVEIQASSADTAQSQTQFLLQSNSANADANGINDKASSRQDSQLAEQFNRSLFLPTAQEIPDTWQIYARQVAMAIGVVVIGFGVGFGAAVAPDMLSGSGSHQQVAATDNAKDNDENAAPAQTVTDTAQINKTGDSEAAANDLTAANASTATTNSATTSTTSSPEQALSNSETARQSTQQTTQQTANVAPTQENTPPSEPDMLVLGLQPEQTSLSESLQDDDLNRNPEVSQALLKKFQKVMTEMEAQQNANQFVASSAPDVPEPDDVPRVDQMPQWILSSLPRLSFNAHMFATEPADRWVKVNGKELGEGDWIDGQLRINRIDPQHIVLDFQGHEFSMKALSDW